MELRREIHEVLNVIEFWSGANDLIIYGRGGEIAANRLEDHEATMLALHLLQNCRVCVNTLMLRRVLGEPIWLERMGTNERAGDDTALQESCESLRHLPARYDRPPNSRSFYVRRPHRPATAARRLTIPGTRYFASGDTNDGSVPFGKPEAAIAERLAHA
jgi:hypothetical protein